MTSLRNANPHESFPPELENDVDRTLKLLEEIDAGTRKLDKKVVLRALIVAIQQKIEPEQPQSAVDAVLQQPQQQPSAMPGGFQPAYGPGRHPFYGPPGKSRPPGVPDPGIFGPQSF